MTTDQPLVMGTNEQGVANAWFVALGRLVAQAGAGLSTVPVPERPTTPLPTHNLCRIELTGLVALGNLQKARSGVLRDRANSWADRLVVTLPHPAPPCPTRPHPTPPDPTLPHHRRHSRLCTRLHHAGAHAPDLLEQGAQGVG